MTGLLKLNQKSSIFKGALTWGSCCTFGQNSAKLQRHLITTWPSLDHRLVVILEGLFWILIFRPQTGNTFHSQSSSQVSKSENFESSSSLFFQGINASSANPSTVLGKERMSIPDNTQSASWLTVGPQSTNFHLMQMSWSTVNQLLIKCQSRCWLSVERVSIRKWIKCQSRWWL